MTHFLCRMLGHRFVGRFDQTQDGTMATVRYLGDICTRCAQPVPDRLHEKIPLTTRDSYAVLHLPGRDPVTIAVTQLELGIQSRQGPEFTLRGRGVP